MNDKKKQRTTGKIIILADDGEPRFNVSIYGEPTGFDTPKEARRLLRDHGEEGTKYQLARLIGKAISVETKTEKRLV